MRTVGLAILLLSCLAMAGCFASIEEVCDKCEECLERDPYFDEGFCLEYWDGTEFNRSRCVREDGTYELEGEVPSAEIDDMSCSEFDSQI